MPVINKRSKCPFCRRWMEVGEKFVFANVMWYGVDKYIPVHVECGMSSDTQATLQKIKEKAATNTEGVGMNEQSILDELKSEIDRGKLRGQMGVSNTRLEALIRKYETQAPGDTTDQPGQWQIRGGNVDAVQHDGTPEQAAVVLDWVHQRGGRAERYRDFHDDTVNYVRLDSPRQPNIVGPQWWVVKTADDMFYAVSDADFHIIYVPREKNSGEEG